MKTFKVLPIKVPAGNEHPPAPYEGLPKHEFTMGLIGVYHINFLAPKGCGKTTLVGNLLRAYSGYFHDIHVFSPTIESDDKWDVLKKEKYLIENKPLKRWIQTQRDKKHENKVVNDPPGAAE